mgnify:FL=1
MTLYEELYFEITVNGAKSDLKKFVKYLKSGELDDFFDVNDDNIAYDDDFASADDAAETGFTFTNDDLGVEIDEFNPEDFLDIFCKAAKNLDLSGRLYDLDDEEYVFTSERGSTSYVNSKKIKHFNDELDEEAYEEEREEDEE